MIARSRGPLRVCVPPRHACLCVLALAFVTLAWPAGAARTGATFKDWTVRCEPLTPGAEETCYIFQDLLLRKDKQRLLHMAVGYLSGSHEAVALLTLPLGVSLPGGVSLRVDGGPLRRLRYERCEAKGCIAPLVLEEDLIRSLKAGREARVSFFDASRREVSVPVSLLGFTAGFDALDAPQARQR